MLRSSGRLISILEDLGSAHIPVISSATLSPALVSHSGFILKFYMVGSFSRQSLISACNVFLPSSVSQLPFRASYGGYFRRIVFPKVLLQSKFCFSNLLHPSAFLYGDCILFLWLSVLSRKIETVILITTSEGCGD